MKKISGVFIVIVIIAVLVLIFLNPIVIIPSGHIGIKVLFGKVMPGYLENGIHLVNPLLNIVKTDARLQTYTMSIATTEGGEYGDDAIDALTSEGLLVRLDLTAWYKLIPENAPELYRTIGLDYEEKIVRPLLRTAIRDITVKYTAEDLYSGRRDEYIVAIKSRADSLIAGKGILLDNILLRNVKLPKDIENAINAKISADQEARRMQFVLDKERQEKERKIIEAEGIREANKIIAQGLTSSYIAWYRIEMLKQLVTSQNNTIVIIPDDLKSMPMILPTSK